MKKLLCTIALATQNWQAWQKNERGDVPGWVMVTLMTAGLVAAIGAVATPALVGLFESAIAQVSA